MRKKYLFLFIFISVFNFTSLGQTQDLKEYQADTALVNKYIELCRNIVFINPDSTQQYLDTIFSLSQKTNYEHGLFNSYNLKGLILWVSNDMDNAILQFKEALKYCNNTNEPRKKAIVLGNIGLIFTNKFNMDSAQYYLNKTIIYSEENNINDLRLKAMFDLSNLLIDQGKYTVGIRYLIKIREDLDINKDSLLLMYVYNSFGVLFSRVNMFDLSLLNYKKAIAVDYHVIETNNIANTFLNIGELYFQSGINTDSAIYYYRKAVSSALPHNKRHFELAANINLGNVFLINNQLDSAKIHYDKAFGDSLIQNYPSYKAALFVNLGIYYSEKKDYEKAKEFLITGNELSNKLNLLLFEKNALQHLSILDSTLGNFKQSLKYYKSYHRASDSLNADKLNNEIIAIEFKKYLERQKASNMVLVEENKLKSKQIWAAFIAIIILLIFLYSLYINRVKIKRLLKQLSVKNDEMMIVNEELNVTNEVLNNQQDQLRELNIAKDKFFSILGHDLKSPFNSLLGMLSLINNDWELINDEKKQSLLQSLYSSSIKTHNLLEDLLSWGKAQRGLIKFNPEPFSLSTKIEEVVELFEAQLSNKKLQMNINVASDITLNTDVRLFSQIIQNFVNNAIKYTKHGGSITIKTDLLNKQVHLCVIDTGIGIPENKISSLFDLDSDFNRPGTNNEKSTGMGLILSKEYAELMNAKITVSSIEGEGSTFCLILPDTV